MTLPRMSIVWVMAVAAVAAVDCAMFRALEARPDLPPVGRAWMAVLTTLPMVHLLAVAAALRLRGRGPSRASLLGFELAGWAAIGVTLGWLRPWLDGLEASLVAGGLEKWVDSSPTHLNIVIYALMPACFLLPQILIAMVGGMLGRRLRRGRGEPAPGRSRLAAVGVLVGVAALPAVGVEAYLRLRVDFAFERLDLGTVAVVDYHCEPGPPLAPARGSFAASLEGARVKVDSDSAPWSWEVTLTPDGVEHIRDLRPVGVTLVGGDRPGQVALVPHCALRVVR